MLVLIQHTEVERGPAASPRSRKRESCGLFIGLMLKSCGQM